MSESEINKFEVLAEIIRSRRAIFPSQYIAEPIESDVIDQLLELAKWAPTHRMTEPWRFTVISGNARIRLGKFLAETYKNISSENFSQAKFERIAKKCTQSQYIILICIQYDVLKRVPEWEELAAVSMSVQNMWLACSALGIGCYWSSPSLKDHISDFIPMEAGMKCLGMFYIGSFDGSWPIGRRAAMTDKVQFITS